MSLVDSIQKVFVPIHREGWPFIGVFALVTIVLGLIWEPLFFVGLVLTAWCTYFFRDPERITPLDDDIVVSPADGVVSAIGPVVPPEELGLGSEVRTRISVFMNVFSVHVNRSPVRGEISKIAYKPGKFLNADLDKASRENERNGVVIESPHGQIATVQVAGLIARRILCFANEGEQLTAGERFGLIRFGSRLDIYLPQSAVPQVAIGQNAIAGETVIAGFGDNYKLRVTRKG